MQGQKPGSHPLTACRRISCISSSVPHSCTLRQVNTVFLHSVVLLADACLSRIPGLQKTGSKKQSALPEPGQLSAGTKDRCRLSGVCQRWRRMLGRPEYWQVRCFELKTCDLTPSVPPTNLSCKIVRGFHAPVVACSWAPGSSQGSGELYGVVQPTGLSLKVCSISAEGQLSHPADGRHSAASAASGRCGQLSVLGMHD